MNSMNMLINASQYAEIARLKSQNAKLQEALRNIANGETTEEFKEDVRGLSEEAFYESHWKYCMEIAKQAIAEGKD